MNIDPTFLFLSLIPSGIDTTLGAAVYFTIRAGW